MSIYKLVSGTNKECGKHYGFANGVNKEIQSIFGDDSGVIEKYIKKHYLY